jgi:ribosome-associated protein
MPRKTATSVKKAPTAKRRPGVKKKTRSVEAKRSVSDTLAASRLAQRERAREFAIGAARVLGDGKCGDIVVLDVGEKSSVTDYLVIASGTSDRQMRSVLHHVEELGVETGYTVLRTSTDDRATWLLADFVNVVVHLFEPNTRAHYDLEMMWGDAKRVTWARRGGARKATVGGDGAEE